MLLFMVQPMTVTTPRRKARTRLCVGCGVREQRARGELLRLVFVEHPDGGHTVAVDLAGREVGRGAWLHPRPNCLQLAVRKGLSKAARGRVRASEDELAAMIAEAAGRRVERLLGVARRSAKLVCGSAAVEQCSVQGRAALVVVAKDAAAASKLTAVRIASTRGAAMSWGTKAALAAALAQHNDIGVVAITDADMATALAKAIAVVEGFDPALRDDSESGRQEGGSGE
jgi:predicted RNA-binding protein YlxR (DUF448 family)